MKSRVDEIMSRLVLNGEGTAIILSDDGEHAVGDIVFLLAQVTSLDADLAAEREAHEATKRALAEAVLERNARVSLPAEAFPILADVLGDYIDSYGDPEDDLRPIREALRNHARGGR